MAKKLLQTWTGDGALTIKDRIFPVSYAIEARGDSNFVEVRGTVAGLSPVDSYDLLVEQDGLKLRLVSGEVVEIAFFGGAMGGPGRIVVNSPMPGIG